ncbi:MAG: hypothetical protein ABIQ30_00170 [Devosia sp.]
MAASGAPSQTEYSEIENLVPIIERLVDDIIFESTGSNTFPQISKVASHYRGALGHPLGTASIDQLYAHGVRLDNLYARYAREVAAGELPDHSLGLGEALESLLALHGTMILTTHRGRQLLEAARTYHGGKHVELAYKAKAVEFADRLTASPGVVTFEAASVVLEINREVGSEPHADRSTEVARTTNFNFLAATSKIAIYGVLGTMASSVLVMSVPGGAAITIGIDLFNACWYFLLNNEQVLRGLVGVAGHELSWLNPLLDLITKSDPSTLQRILTGKPTNVIKNSN